MQDKIIAAIAAYLEKNTLIEYVSGESDFQTRYQFAAEQIAAAIAPLVESGEVDWKAAPKWAEWRVFDNKGSVLYLKSFPSGYTNVPKRFGITQKVERRPQ